MATVPLFAVTFGAAWCFRQILTAHDVEADTHRSRLAYARDAGYLFIFICVCCLFLMFLWLSDALSGGGTRVWNGFS